MNGIGNLFPFFPGLVPGFGFPLIIQERQKKGNVFVIKDFTFMILFNNIKKIRFSKIIW